MRGLLVFVTMAEVKAGASLLAGVATAAVMSLNAAASLVIGVISVSSALSVQDIGGGGTGDADEALPAAAAATHAALLSTCAARRSSNDFPIRTIV